jgi:hyperosmotically inducible protein
MKSKLLALAVVAALSVGAVFAADPNATPSRVDDAAITAKVKAELMRDPDTKAHQINVDTNAGVVQLSGFVDTVAARTKAEDDARLVQGVQSVSNRLEVRSEERTAGRSIDDATLTAKVKGALIENSITKAHDINVTTNGGVVQLNGFVDTAQQSSKAVDIARSIDGVKEVQNNLEVKAKKY